MMQIFKLMSGAVLWYVVLKIEELFYRETEKRMK